MSKNIHPTLPEKALSHKVHQTTQIDLIIKSPMISTPHNAVFAKTVPSNERVDLATITHTGYLVCQGRLKQSLFWYLPPHAVNTAS